MENYNYIFFAAHWICNSLYLCRLTEKEIEYKEQSSVKLQEWIKALSPLQEWFVKSEQKLDSLENLESSMNNLKRQNQEYLVSLYKQMQLRKIECFQVRVLLRKVKALIKFCYQQLTTILNNSVFLNCTCLMQPANK